MADRTFVGFGFGAIQGGLFLYEAHESGRFDRFVVAEVVPDVVSAVRAHGGRYALNVATRHGIERHRIDGVTILNPTVPEDRELLVAEIARASEIATALPSVDFYTRGGSTAPAAVLADGLARKARSGGPRAILYTAENHNHAAEILAEHLSSTLGETASDRYQCLNTVIGKMSGVVTDAAQIAAQGLDPITPGASRALLVEQFNRILITRVRWPDFDRGIRIFIEKDDLLPFEEAKLYGHNATHALLGYLLEEQGLRWMSDAAGRPELLGETRQAFLEESGAALCRKYAGLDPLFTPGGYREYVDDLMERMINPHLRDAVERITRDPRRKLGWSDRLVGTLRLALAQGITPHRYARGAAVAVRMLTGREGGDPAATLAGIWSGAGAPADEQQRLIRLILG